MTVSVQDSGDIIRKASKATVVLQGFAMLLLLGLIYIFLDTSQRYSSLHDGIRENALWSVYQLDREARRLDETIHIMIVEDDYGKEALAELTTRYDILYSRMTILKKANYEQKFKVDETVGRQIAEIQAAVFGSQAVFDEIAARKTTDKAELAIVKNKLDVMIRSTEQLLVYTNNAVSTARADARDAIMGLQVKSVMVVGLLVLSVGILIISLRRQLTSVRLAGLSLEVISNKLNDAYLATEAGNRSKSQFMATMGHEIRTPLNAILGTAELLELSPLPPSVAPGVQTIRRSGQALLEIINEILDFAKIEHGRLDVEMRAVDVRAVVSATIEIVRDRATEHGNRIHLEIPDTFSTPVVSTDPTRLRQVLLNLLSNAIKFTKNGVVTLKIKELPGMDPASLRLEVIDTGIGIDSNGLCKLFHPFSQVDASISRTYGGTGLGLTICKQIVEALGGRIGVESRKGQGSTFWFEIPSIAATISEEEPHTLPSIPDPGLPVLSVLLVEDKRVNQQVAVGFLKHLGQSVTIANDGLEAVEKASNTRFDLILMDMQMPRLDGIEATRRIRQSGGRSAQVPIIAMTANASDDDRRLCEEAGMTGFQSKPISLHQLQGIIHSLDTTSKPSQTKFFDAIDSAYAARRREIVEALGEETFDELLASFFDDASTLLRELQAALRSNDYRSTDHLLHTLKGAASNIGLQDVADFSQGLRQTSLTEHALTELQKTVTGYKQRLAA